MFLASRRTFTDILGQVVARPEGVQFWRENSALANWGIRFGGVACHYGPNALASR